MSINRIFIALRTYAFGSQRVIPSLDGLRAISIVFVILAHLGGTRGFPFTFYSVPMGIFGVRVFFVISGFLITSILVRELEQTSSISLTRFYFRRMLRLFPASYFLIGVVAVLVSWRLVTVARWDLLFAVTYTMNFYDIIYRGWPLGHLWSLAVEEQFYLLWPLTLRALGVNRSKYFLIGILCTAPFFRIASPYVGPTFNFLIWSDALGTGCLLALLRPALAANARYVSVLRSRWFFLVPVTALLASMVPSTKVQWLCCETVMNVGIAVFIDWAIRNESGVVGRCLNWPAVSCLGVLSYSLYLWQQPFLNRNSAAPYCAFPLNILLTSIAALTSYLIIEAPFIRMRVGIERVAAERLRRRAETA